MKLLNIKKFPIAVEGRTLAEGEYLPVVLIGEVEGKGYVGVAGLSSVEEFDVTKKYKYDIFPDVRWKNSTIIEYKMEVCKDDDTVGRGTYTLDGITSTITTQVLDDTYTGLEFIIKGKPMKEVIDETGKAIQRVFTTVQQDGDGDLVATTRLKIRTPSARLLHRLLGHVLNITPLIPSDESK